MNKVTRRFAAALCAASLITSTLPAPALADTSNELQAQLEQAQTTLNGLYANAEAVSSELNKTLDDLALTESSIEETTEQIEAKQSELGAAQQTLQQTVAATYKDGTVSLLSIVLSSTSFEDFVSRIYYANKINDSYNQQIKDVKEIQNDLAQEKTSLEEQRASLEQLQADQEAQKAQLESRAAEAESYVAGLSSELQDALAAEAAARAEAERAEAQKALEEAQAAQAQASEQETEKPAELEEPEQTPANEDKDESREQEEHSAESSSASASSDTSSDQQSSTSGLSNMAARKAVVDYVLAQVGKPYVWATHGPNSFDCSGLTGAAYDSIGYFVGYSDSYQAQYCNKPASEAVYGDIVWRPGHVGLCIGNGVTVEAHNPALGIGYGSVSNFQRSGSPLG